MVKNIGNRIKYLRLKNELTQKELAAKVNISFQTVSKWEKGINIPDIDTLIKLSDIFNCSIDYLSGKTDKPDINQYVFQDSEIGEIKVDVRDYPHRLTPDEVRVMIEKLKEHHFNVDAIIKDMRKKDD